MSGVHGNFTSVHDYNKGQCWNCYKIVQTGLPKYGKLQKTKKILVE